MYPNKFLIRAAEPRYKSSDPSTFEIRTGTKRKLTVSTQLILTETFC